MPFKRSFPAILILFTNALGATLVIPILPLLAVEKFGATILQAVLLESSYYGAKLIAAPLLGRLSDRIGRRPVLILSQWGTFFSFLLFLSAFPAGRVVEGLWPTLGVSGGLLMLYAARIFDGFTGGNTTVARAYIADVNGQENQAQAFGWLSATLGIGFVIGPALGGIVASQFGLMAPFFLGAVVSAVALILAWFLLNESRPFLKNSVIIPSASFWQRVKISFRRPAFAKIILIGFLSTLCFSALSPIFVLYVNEVFFPGAVNAAEVSRFVGFLYTAVGLTLAITQIGLIKPLVNFFGEIRLIQISQFGMIVSFVIIPLIKTPWMFLLILIPFVIFYAVLEPNIQALLVLSGSPHNQGEVFGIYQSILSVSDLMGPLWAGLVFQQIAPQAVWFVAAVILLPALTLAVFLNTPSIILRLKMAKELAHESQSL